MRTPRCAGLVQVDEGRRLAELAGRVPVEQAIVEVGSHTGLSTCWMAHAAQAHVTAIDPWADGRPNSKDDPFELGSGQAVYERFAANLSSEGLWSKVTPLRTLSTIAAQWWVQPVGLLFIDAVHELEPVKSDYLHWADRIAPGGWLAFHDYSDDPEHEYAGVAQAIEAVVIPSGLWEEPIITLNLWTARKVLA
jgi:hypothetical protein